MREAKKLNPLPAPEPGTKVITEVSEAVRRPPALRVPSMPGPTASLTRAQGAPKLDEILRQRAQFQQEQVSGWHPVLQILWQLLGPPMIQNIVGMFKNTARAMNAYDDHGGLISSSIPREYDDGESGTNAWPVPAWWSRPPSWVDSAPRWWDDLHSEARERWEDRREAGRGRVQRRELSAARGADLADRRRAAEPER